jgi:hypothetical protein
MIDKVSGVTVSITRQDIPHPTSVAAIAATRSKAKILLKQSASGKFILVA